MQTHRVSMLMATSLGTGMKGRQVAERGQQNLGQTLAQTREEQRRQPGVWMWGRNPERGKRRGVESGKRDQDWDGHRDRDGCRERHIYTETRMERQRQTRWG